MINSRVFLLLACTVLLLQSSFLQLASGQLEPDTIFDFKIGEKARTTQGNVTADGPVQQINLTSWLVSGNASYLRMVNRYTPASVSNPGPFCYLEVVPRTALLNNVTSAIVTSWTKPCPRTAQQVTPVAGFWCEFEFSVDGNMILRSGGANGTGFESGTVLWSSNTAGLDVQRVGMVDFDDELLGNLVLYNSSEAVVWRNILNNPVGEDFGCSDAPPTPVGAPSPPAGGRKLLHDH